MVVAQYQGIVNFRFTHHTMWIQESRDLAKEWMQLCYYINGEDVEIVMQDWNDEWKIPIIHKEVPMGKVVEVGGSKTHARDGVAPKRISSRS
jgi:hypothetical protein